MSTEHISEVIESLDRQIAAARSASSRLGYFPALYRRVTLAVARGIEDGHFDDGPRMERLDVHFANRYLEAFAGFSRGEETTRSWQVCFRATDDHRPIVLQHLALAMNAHINLDLGIAAARTCPGEELPALRRDFDRINRILASLVDEVERNLAAIWPLLRPIDLLSGRKEERLAGFSLEVARDHAWRVAESLAPLAEDQQDGVIDRVDRWISAFGVKLHRPGLPLSALQRVVRLGERGSPADIIDTLS